MGPLSDSDLSGLRNILLTEVIEFDLWVYVMVIAIILIFLIFSAFFSSTETALSTANTIRLRRLVEERKRGAQKAIILIENYDRTITSILIGNNLCNIGASTAAAFIFTNLILNPSIASITSTIVMTLIVIIFSEILPKTYAKANPTKVMLRFSGLMWFFYKFFYPIAFIFMKLTALMKGDAEGENHAVTGEELETIIDTMEDEGVFDEDHADIIQGAVSLGYKKVSEIMTPRVDTIAVEINDTPDDIYVLFLETQYSRLPVYDTDKDNMVGILQIKDFLPALIQADDKDSISIKDLMIEPLYVSKQTKVDDLIKVMQDTKRHFAIVSDEYGGTSGIVTMEDALEELVGEIYDEYDSEEEHPFLNKVAENEYFLSADLDLNELYEELELGQPPIKAYTTVGSLIYDLCEGLPEVNMVVELNSVKTIFEDNEFVDIKYLLKFEIVTVENRRIRELNLYIEDITDLEDADEDEK